MSLLKLPYEMVSYVLDDLDLDDVWQLSLTCRHLWSLVTESNIAKRLLERKAPAATETHNAHVTKNYARELRRLMKRRQSISSVTPYMAAVVSFVEDWIYRNGVLCYIRQGELRLLDLHGSAADEIVVNIRLLLDKAIPEFRNLRTYRLRPLNVSNNIVSCLYYYKQPCSCYSYQTPCSFNCNVYAGSLVVFNTQTRKILTAPYLADLDPKRLIIRNNDKVLYIIRRSRYHGRRAMCWAAYDIVADTWLALDFPLSDNSQSQTYDPNNGFQPFDIDITNCFELFDNSIYSLSNHSNLENDEKDWTTKYTYLRIDPPFHLVVPIKSHRPFRRDHRDGPMDHRWTFMMMFKDEATGEIKVVESRKEWIKGSSSTVRTYYTTTIDSPNVRTSTRGTDSEEDSPDEDSSDENNIDGNNSVRNSISPNHPRDPQTVHPGYYSSKGPIFLRNKCPILSYHPSCQTFLDLVDFSPSNSAQRRMRIWGGTRRRRRPEEIEDRNGSEEEERTLSVAEKHFEEVYKMYKHEEPVVWPPDQDPRSPNPALTELYEILSPPNYAGEITSDWDERSFVYAAGATGGDIKEKALVFVSFDPSISLAGTLPYPGSMVFGRPQSVNTNAPTTTDNSGAQRHISTGRVAPAKATQMHSTDTNAAWCTIEPAQYQTIKKGFHFCV